MGYSTARREVVLQLRRLLGRDEGERTVLDLDELLGTRGGTGHESQRGGTGNTWCSGESQAHWRPI
ncbi:hypothetical protein [Thermogymnomonas acidicola]|uniref:hypothetical protein n=1 Tax=Thermogymnomonas acidicola TaxID=399579 RepID=UPI0009461F1E|nr:hypothetical protein [Thermogymnomonas acidicola]